MRNDVSRKEGEKGGGGEPFEKEAQSCKDADDHDDEDWRRIRRKKSSSSTAISGGATSTIAAAVNGKFKLKRRKNTPSLLCTCP